MNLRILVVHNSYRDRGGEDEAVASEVALLRTHGNSVREYRVRNEEIESEFPVLAGVRSVWNWSQYKALKNAIAEFQPQIVHVHNMHPIISPAVFDASMEAGVPVVQTLHNYRMVCPKGSLMRNGSICESCLGKRFAWPAVVHGCYRGRAATLATATMLGFHHLIGTWSEKVDCYIAVSEFARSKYVQGGMPSEKIRVKPNFVVDPGCGDGQGDYVVFVGRLDEQKGVPLLLEAWSRIKSTLTLKIFGGGPLQSEVVDASRKSNLIKYEGVAPLDRVLKEIGGARALLFTSQSYECMPRTIVEAFAKGTPVIAAALGAACEMVEHRRTGLCFEYTNAGDLVSQIHWMLDHADEWQAIRRQARREYEAKYTATSNYRSLMNIYLGLIDKASERPRVAAA